jgi:hypothetical protein
MAKISDEERHLYFGRIKPYREAIEEILKREKSTLAQLHQPPPDAALQRINLVDDMLNLASNFIILNGVSQAVLKVKNVEALNDARKSLYKAVIYLEDIVSSYMDAPFAEYEEKLAEIAFMDAARRYLLIRKMGLAIQLLEDAYGDNTKWKWAFVELEGRYAVVAKNILDLRNAVANTDPRSPQYEPTVYHLRLVKKLLGQAADRYREKYELSTNRIDDFKQGINFLNALKRIYTLMGNRFEADAVRKKSDIWTAKLDLDARRNVVSPKNS